MPVSINGTTGRIVGDIEGNVTGIASSVLDNSVTSGKIVNGAVTNDKLSLAANAGEIKKALNADNSPPIYACRAWVNFDGTKNVNNTGGSTNGQPVFIRASGNVSNIVKNSAGVYTITLAVPMPDEFGAAFCDASFTTPEGDQVDFKEAYIVSSSTIRVGLFNVNTFQDASRVYVMLFR